MKTIKLSLLMLAGILFGCQQVELADPDDTGAVEMKTVTISAGIDGTDTKASLDSQTGAFTWQSGDLISVLATDGNFYDFILEGEYGVKTAEFVGKIPETAAVTTVATYPRIVDNGTANTVLSGNTLNYVLPATWNYAKDVSNVPMVATFGEGAEHMSFKQVGGVMRFPVKNLPTEAQFVVTMNDKTITGQFPVDITALGESCMTAGTAASELVINYTSDVDGADAEFNVPVPTGVYNNFKVTIKDAEGNELFTKNYSADNKVERVTLLNMKELVLPERPIVISDVWPFFVDARVVFGKYDGVSEYAFYIDGASEPVIVAAEDLGDKAGALIGGKFAHKSTHTVAVAKVVDGEPVAASKSAEVTFTTANIRQLTTNTGTKFVSVGWDDVAIPNGTKYENGKWTALPKLGEKDGLKGHQRRGYEVRLLDAAGNVVYEMIPFCGHEAFTGPYSDSSWLGQINGTNIMIPTALAFGYLEPGKDYYFQVRTLAEPVIMDETNGNYIPDGDSSQPYPYTLTSERGGCAWSEPVKVSTDPAHVPSQNEVFFEGFDDIMLHSDYMNWAPAVVPDFVQERISFADYCATFVTNYPEFIKNPRAHTKWTVQAFSKQIWINEIGALDSPYVADADNVLNANAGSLKGWSYNSTASKRTIMPIFGAVRIGQSGSSNNGLGIKTAPIYSENLNDDVATKCVTKLKLAYCSTNIESPSTSTPLNVMINVVRDGVAVGTQYTLNVRFLYPEEYAENVIAHNQSKNDYAHHQRYYEVECELYLKNGDQIELRKPTSGENKGMLVIGEVLVEAVPGAYENNAFVDNGIGSHPDNTDYDAFNMGKFPITYWWNIPTAAHNYDPEETMRLYKELADAGFNLVNYSGEVDGSLAENIRIMNVCTELGMKFMGCINEYGELTDERINAIKNNLAKSDTYVAEFLVDEPKATRYDELGDFTKRYMQAIPDKEVYINLYPNYASSLGTTSYDAYIDEYLEKIPTKSLSYDYYGLNGDGLNTGYYRNLDLVRSKTLANRKPFWVITQAGKVGSCVIPTEKEQRWTVWSTIASGSKGISYFCYWTPDNHADYIIRRDGKKTEMYDWVKQINADIYTIGTKLIHCHADGSIHSSTNSYPLFDNEGAGRTKYGPIQRVSSPNTSVICGCFRDARVSENGDNYKGYKAMLVSRFASRVTTAKAELTLDPSVTKITVTHCNKVQEVDIVSNMAPVNVGSLIVKYLNNVLTVEIPDGEAALIEF